MCGVVCVFTHNCLFLGILNFCLQVNNDKILIAVSRHYHSLYTLFGSTEMGLEKHMIGILLLQVHLKLLLEDIMILYL